LGFSIILILSGIGASALGAYLFGHRHFLAQIGGILTMVLGLEISGIIHIGLFQRDVHFKARPAAHGLSAVFLGMVFAAGWTPCVGPIWASILILAAHSRTVWAGTALLAGYAFGLAGPFLILALFAGQAAQFVRKLGRYLPWIERISGWLLVILGILLISGTYERLTTIMLSP
ncbi:MAG: cytochrome c biogenesis CcdA family protein, partial [Firmicutes bacterium]|nr:cytochrome c biogenesis CcdA family protein [Bacillota bacterium]